VATSTTSANTAATPGAEAFTSPVRHRSHLDTRPSGSMSNTSSSSSRCAWVRENRAELMASEAPNDCNVQDAAKRLREAVGLEERH
jgi:hypothetical protein